MTRILDRFVWPKANLRAYRSQAAAKEASHFIRVITDEDSDSRAVSSTKRSCRWEKFSAFTEVHQETLPVKSDDSADPTGVGLDGNEVVTWPLLESARQSYFLCKRVVNSPAKNKAPCAHESSHSRRSGTQKGKSEPARNLHGYAQDAGAVNGKSYKMWRSPFNFAADPAFIFPQKRMPANLH